MARECIFCGAAADSKEHVFPAWMARIWATKPGTLAEYMVGSSDRPPDQWKRWTRQPFTQTVREVCRGCNTGWMAELEGRARQLLPPMMRGETVRLDPEAKAVLALWMSKTAFVASLTSPDLRAAVPAAHFRFLRDHAEPPTHSKIWLAQRIPPKEVHPIVAIWSQRIDYKDEALWTDSSSPLCGVVMVVEHLLAFLLFDTGLGMDTRAALQSGGQQRTLKIWPHSDYHVWWPPAHAYSESELDQVRRIWERIENVSPIHPPPN